MSWQIIHGDCLAAMAGMPAESVEWLAARLEEALRVAKPGAHALVWLPRTSHWTGLALHEAGWEVRDVVTHLFGSGVPEVAGRVQGDRQDGTTGCAAVLEGFDFTGTEERAEFVAICNARLAYWSTGGQAAAWDGAA
jgi:hypothetical protein